MTRLSQALLVSLFVSPLVACVPEGVEHTQSRSGAVSSDPGNLDILFMVDNSESMTPLQMKMLAQDPGFMTVLENLPHGLPNIHVAVVSSDLGAPSDVQASIGCTATGDGGLFQATPRGACTNTTLTAGSTFISNVDGEANYTGNLQDVFGCIAQLGETGCGFEHQLASVARALGADGSPAPASNVGFLRDDAELAIVLLTNEDDCSATPPTTIYSLNGYQQNIANPDGPIANYRCNGGPRGAHYCQDPANNDTWMIPPLNPPADAQGSAAAPTLDLANCIDNEQPPTGTGTSALTSVAQFINGIKALKADPDNQIVVGTISAPPTPYTVAWVPESGGQNTQPGELWPEVEHSCGAVGGDDVNPAGQMTTDGSFGDPSVRIAQWVNAFGSDGVVTSICDANYSTAFQTIANRIAAHLYGSTGAGGAGGQIGGGGQTGSAGTNGAAGAGGATGTGGAAGASGAAGVGGTAGGNGTGTGGGSVAGGSGTGAGGNNVAGASGTGTGGSGAAGASGTGTGGSSVAGASGTGTGGSGVAGASGTGTGGSSVAGASGTGTGGSSVAGVSGTGSGGSGVAGASGTGAGGSGVAGASGTGAGGSSVAGASGTGSGGSGIAGASGTGAGGTATAGTGTGGGAAGGATGSGGSGTGGAGAAAGKAGSGTGGAGGDAGTGTRGTTTSGAASGCSCDTGGATTPRGLGLGLLLSALLLAARRRAAVSAEDEDGRNKRSFGRY